VLSEFGTKPAKKEWKAFAERVFFAGGGCTSDSPGSLLDDLAKARESLGGDPQLVHYLAVPPVAFEGLTRALGQYGLATDARVGYEKPFGTSPASFRSLDRVVHSVLDEQQVYRIDDVEPGDRPVPGGHVARARPHAGPRHRRGPAVPPARRGSAAAVRPADPRRPDRRPAAVHPPDGLAAAWKAIAPHRPRDPVQRQVIGHMRQELVGVEALHGLASGGAGHGWDVQHFRLGREWCQGRRPVAAVQQGVPARLPGLFQVPHERGDGRGHGYRPTRLSERAWFPPCLTLTHPRCEFR
jgi:hypothetical protein